MYQNHELPRKSATLLHKKSDILLKHSANNKRVKASRSVSVGNEEIDTLYNRAQQGGSLEVSFSWKGKFDTLHNKAQQRG